MLKTIMKEVEADHETVGLVMGIISTEVRQFAHANDTARWVELETLVPLGERFVVQHCAQLGASVEDCAAAMEELGYNGVLRHLCVKFVDATSTSVEEVLSANPDVSNEITNPDETDEIALKRLCHTLANNASVHLNYAIEAVGHQQYYQAAVITSQVDVLARLPALLTVFNRAKMDQDMVQSAKLQTEHRKAQLLVPIFTKRRHEGRRVQVVAA